MYAAEQRRLQEKRKRFTGFGGRGTV